MGNVRRYDVLYGTCYPACLPLLIYSCLHSHITV